MPGFHASFSTLTVVSCLLLAAGRAHSSRQAVADAAHVNTARTPASAPATQPASGPAPTMPTSAPATVLAATLPAEWTEGTPVSRIPEELASLVRGREKIAFALDISRDHFAHAAKLMQHWLAALPTRTEVAIFALSPKRDAIRLADWCNADALGRRRAVNALAEHAAPSDGTNYVGLGTMLARDASSADCVVILTEGPRLRAETSTAMATQSLSAPARTVNLVFVGAPSADGLRIVQGAMGSRGAGRMMLITPRQLAGFANLP